MNIFDIHVVYLLIRNRSCNSSVCIVIVRDMQSRMFTERIIHFNLYFMFALFDVFYYGRKRRKRIIMMCNFFAVKIHICRMTHAIKFKTHITVIFHIYSLTIFALAAIAQKIRVLFPTSRYRHLILFTLCFKIPHSVKLFAFSYSMLFK